MKRVDKSLIMKCPRCGEENFKTQKKCSDCGLVFDRLNYVSNRAGKIAVVRREKENILRVTKWPKDAKKSKALLLCGFLGLVGAHNFYLGRYVKGFFSLIVTLVACVCIMLENVIDYASFYESFFFLPTGIMFLMWWVDFILIAMNKYKIPVALDYEYPEENKKEKNKNKKENIKKLKNNSKNKLEKENNLEKNTEINLNTEINNKKLEENNVINIEEFKNKEKKE